MADLKENAAIRLEKAKKFKEEGTEFLNAGEYVKAIDKYRKILDNLDAKEMVGQNETERKNLLQAAQLNIALCWIKMKEWKRAKVVCSKIIESDKDVVKVSFS